MSDAPNWSDLMALIERVMADAAFAAIVRAESKRTVCCTPEDVDRIRWHVDQAGLGDVLTVVESPIVPPGHMIVIDEQALEAQFRELLGRPGHRAGLSHPDRDHQQGGQDEPMSGLPGPSFTCPRCEAVSQQPDDVAQGYCGRCHKWTGAPSMADEPWLDPAAWQAATGPRPGTDHVTVPVCDPQLGTIAAVRHPDGRETYGADSPRPQARPGNHAGTSRPAETDDAD